MPTYRIAAKRLTPGEFSTNWRLVRLCKTELEARAFRLDIPVRIERQGEGRDAIAIIAQDDQPGRLPNNHGSLWPFIASLSHGDASVIGQLAGTLEAAGDDRAAMVRAIGFEVPETDVGFYYADTFGETDAGAATAIDTKALAARETCRRVLLLFGVETTR